MADKRPVLPGVSLTRISIPQLNPHFILRKKLLESFDKPSPHAILLVAPGGFGKTVLSAQWAMQKPEITAWYTAQVGDSARDILFHVIQGLRKVKPDLCSWAEDLPETGFDIEKVAKDFANEVGELGPEIRIVFDSLGNASGPEELQLQQAWQINAPMNIKTLSNRQTPPNSPLTRAINAGALTYLTARDLKFDESEVLALTTSLNLDPEDVQLKAALAPTDGWPAGVHMTTRLFTTGDHSTYADHKLIYEASLSSLKKSEREILENLSMVNDFSELEAAEILENESVGSALRVMAVEGLFITKKSSEPDIFEVNTLLREYLRERTQSQPGDCKSRYLACAKVIENSDPVRAFELYLMAGENETAQKFALKNLRRLIFSGSNSKVLHFESVIASAINLGDGRETLLSSYLFANSGDVANAEVKLLEFEKRFGKDPVNSVVVGDIDIIKTELDFLKGEYESVLKRGASLHAVAEVVDIAEDLVHLRHLIKLQLSASAAFLMEDTKSLHEIEKLITSLPTSNDQSINSIYIPSINALVALCRGELNVARENATLAISASRKLKSAGLFTPFSSAYALAEVHREFGDFKRALEICDEFIALASKSKIKPWLVALISKKALILSHMNQNNQALNLLSKVREEVPVPQFSYPISRIIDEHELFVRVALIDVERIQELLYRMPQTATAQAFTKAYAAISSPAKAQAILESMGTETVLERINRELVSAEVFHTQPKIAFEHLRNAVNIGIAHDFFQIFMQQSPNVKNLIIELASKEPTVYLEKLAAALRAQIQVTQNSKRSASGSLTKRELDILRRLSTGLPITQIAAGLHISNNTIKTHLKSVYKKLDVDSRHAAVARAQEMALL